MSPQEQHTPGPWLLMQCIEPDYFSIDSKNGETICHIPKTDEANAHLIVASPVMLKALEAIEEGLAAIEPEFQAGPLVVVRTMQGTVRGALAQARPSVAQEVGQ